MHIKEFKTVEQWREELDRDSLGGRGRFMILSRSLFNSKAFAALGWPGTIVALSVINKLEYHKRGRKDRKGVKVGKVSLRNNGEFVLTINELVARGLSRSSATRGRVMAWEIGLFDVIEPGTIHHAGKYRYSERWKRYPNADHKPLGQQTPGKNIYPQGGFQRKTEDSSEISVEPISFAFPDYLRVAK